MPKKIDWEPIKTDYLAGVNVPDLIAKYGVSDRSIERQMAAGEWAKLKLAQNVVSFAKPVKKAETEVEPSRSLDAKKAKPLSPRLRSEPDEDRVRILDADLDTEELLSTAIRSLSGDISSISCASGDKAAMAMAKLIETYRKFHPQTMDEAIDWLLRLPNFDPLEFAKKLRERFDERRAG